MILDITNTDLNRVMRSHKNFVLIDVRSAIECAQTGTIPGALNLDLQDGSFEAAIPTLSRSKTYYFVCDSGFRSAHACRLMNKAGFHIVYNIEGGMTLWSKYDTEMRKVA